MTEEQQGRGQSLEEEEKELKERMAKIEEDPPEKLEDWPDDDLKYQTYGGAEGDHSYDEGPEAKLGPSSLQRHEDGSVTIEGEEVENPDEFKQEPIEGLPQDRQAEENEEQQSEPG